MYLKKKIRKLLRYKINNNNRKKLKKKEVSIISSNCIGGVISHELGLQFKSPTVNIYMKAHDYIKFCYNLERYLKEELSFIGVDQDGHFMAFCGDIKIYAVHYKNFEEFSEKWYERSKRVDFNNLYFIMSERDGCNMDDIIAFDNLPYNNKVIFTKEDMPDIKSAVHIPNTKQGKHHVVPMTSYLGTFTGRRYVDLFDYVEFLNTGKLKLK